MKFLAFEIENNPIDWANVSPAILEEEAREIFRLQQAEIIRQIWFREDTKSAIIDLECNSHQQAVEMLATLPLVRKGFIRFDVIHLVPYSGYWRLFSKQSIS